jgi:hypothetical protein
LNCDIWIADTGATCDISPHMYGAQNVQEDSNNIVFVDGNQHKTSLKVNVCRWLGNDQTHAVKMSDIVYAPTAKYNMFSLTKCLKQGWHLRGDESKIELYNHDFTVTFNIKIPMKNGFFICNVMYLISWRIGGREESRQQTSLRSEHA